MFEIFLNGHPLLYIFYSVTMLWLFEFILLRPKSKGDKSKETQSFLMILSGVISVVLLNIINGLFPSLRIPIESLHKPLMYIGLVVYITGLLLRYVSIMYLGNYFTRDVSIETKHELISKGPYRLFRHPLYVGLFLLTTSVPLFFGHYLVYVYAFIVMSFILNHRMRIEESLLESHFKHEYTIWKSKRYRFIPFIY